MPDFRVKYGLAYGNYGNFQARTDGLFSNTDTTPDVSLGYLWYADVGNTASITYFDGLLTGGVNGVEEGKEIKVLFLGTGTTLVDSAILNLAGGHNWTPDIGDVGVFIHHSSAWYEVGRTSAGNAVLSVTSSNLGAAAAPRLNIRNTTTVVQALAVASSLMTLHAMPGGYDGQTVTIVAVGSQVTFITNSAALTDGFITTSSAGTTYILNGSSAISFMRATMGGTAKWFEVRDLS